MFDYTGRIVQATAGRDKDGVFCVVGVDHGAFRLLLADGKRSRKSWDMCGFSPKRNFPTPRYKS